jgi:hypothetical protein
VRPKYIKLEYKILQKPLSFPILLKNIIAPTYYFSLFYV